MTDLSTTESRAKLTQRGDPYTHKVARYKYLCYRRGANGGTWLAKLQMPKTKRKFQSIGDESDHTYEQALAKALVWFDSGGEATALPDSKLTVGLACSRYLTHRYNEKSEQGYKSTKSLFDCHVFSSKLANKPVATAETADYQSWLKATGARLVRNHKHPEEDERRRLGRYTANITWAFVRAALYHAAKTNKKLPAAEWKAVEILEDGQTRGRDVWLAEAEVQRLINVIPDPDFRDLALAGAATGARVGELKAMKVRDLNLAEGKWTPSKSKSKKKGRRVRFLDSQAIELLTRLCAGKSKTDYVFTHNGQPWKKQNEHLMRAAAKKAKLDPATCFYSIRHAYISRQLKAGVQPLFIAENCGTSVKQIEDHYGHFAEEEKRRLLAQGAMKLEIPPTNVVAM